MKKSFGRLLLTRLLSAICLAIFTGCQTDAVYHSYKPTGANGWRQGDTLSFRLPTTITGRHYMLEIGVKHTVIYPYKDLWVEIRNEERTDSFHILLTDSLNQWAGYGMASSSYQFVTEPINYYLSESDTLLHVNHLMSDTLLGGVTDIGIRLSFAGGINTQKHEQQDGETPQ